jgi:RNA polymerase sigma-70 factor, ECF subfamily
MNTWESIASLRPRLDRTLAISMCFLSDDARADLVQDTLLYAFQRRWDRVREAEHPLTYLKTMAMHIYFNKAELLKNKAQHLYLPDYADELISEEANPEKVCAQRDFQKQVRSAIGKLNKAQQTTIRLFYLEGRSLKEIAEATNLPLNTVKSHNSRAKEVLSRSLQEVTP